MTQFSALCLTVPFSAPLTTDVVPSLFCPVLLFLSPSIFSHSDVCVVGPAPSITLTIKWTRGCVCSDSILCVFYCLTSGCTLKGVMTDKIGRGLLSSHCCFSTSEDIFIFAVKLIQYFDLFSSVGVIWYLM